MVHSVFKCGEKKLPFSQKDDINNDDEDDNDEDEHYGDDSTLMTRDTQL